MSKTEILNVNVPGHLGCAVGDTLQVEIGPPDSEREVPSPLLSHQGHSV